MCIRDSNYAPSAAALINGTLAHSLDFDDTHAEASLHSSAPILSAALSAAQMKNCSGQQLITACVIGYEIQIRLGLAGGASKHYNRGFHPTATCGIFGAVAATGHILGLNKNQFISAFGIALSQSSGSMEFLNDGSWTKRSHVGQAAQNGLKCAVLALEGFKGPQQAFEGKWGYLNSFVSGGDSKKALNALGENFETLNLGVKPYPSCRYSHAAIDGLLELKEEIGFVPPIETLNPLDTYHSKDKSFRAMADFIRQELGKPVTRERLKHIRRKWKGPLVIKGIMHPADAEAAVKMGYDGILVSNHGGRQLDACLSPVEVLADIITQVDGRATIMVDSGFSNGLDIARGIALGADFVFCGRAFMWGVSVLGQKGPEHVINLLSNELQLALTQIGCPSVNELNTSWLDAKT